MNKRFLYNLIRNIIVIIIIFLFFVFILPNHWHRVVKLIVGVLIGMAIYVLIDAIEQLVKRITAKNERTQSGMDDNTMPASTQERDSQENIKDSKNQYGRPKKNKRVVVNQGKTINVEVIRGDGGTAVEINGDKENTINIQVTRDDGGTAVEVTRDEKDTMVDDSDIK